MTSPAARPRRPFRLLSLLVVGAAVLVGCGLPPGGEPPSGGDLVAELVSTDPHVAVPTTLDRIRIEIEIEVTREDDGSVGSMSIEDVDGLPSGWSTSTSSSCIDTPTDRHCTAEITATGPADTPPGSYPVEVELRVDGETILVDATLTVPV